MSEIRVHVINKKGRKSLYLLAKNSTTGERFERSARTMNKKRAEKAAMEWQLELERGYRPEMITWAKFVERFETEHLSEIRVSSQQDAKQSVKMFTEFTSPQRLRDVNESRIATFRKRLQERSIAVTTVAKHLRNLKTAVNWAVDQKLLPNPPKIRMPKVPKGSASKGRAATAEEFDRMEAATSKVVGAELANDWLFFLRGLWWSGLRLAESLTLSWDEWHDGLTIDTSGEFVLLRIPAEHEKGGRHRLLPIAPQFEEMLLSVPEDQRTGFVFNPRPMLVKKHERAIPCVATRIISQIGEAAGIVVSRKPKLKYASAHDLRRAFGTRWAKLVTPAVLKDLMRHRQIETTMKYYVGSEAQDTAQLLRRVMAAAEHPVIIPSRNGVGSQSE
jgi:integrase